ncbi:MAG: hypothetical protein ACOH5I_10535 [Oligoflexus sp.]
MDLDALKSFMVELIEESFCPQGVELANRWQGGTLTLQPGNDSQSKEIPIEVLFKKLISIRESLRVLEQKINTNPSLSQEDKLSLQSYVTRSYGALTTFNILFKDGKDKFVGSSDSGNKTPKPGKMSMSEMKKKIGLNEYD